MKFALFTAARAKLLRVKAEHVIVTIKIWEIQKEFDRNLQVLMKCLKNVQIWKK